MPQPSALGKALNLLCALCSKPGGVSDPNKPFCWPCFENGCYKPNARVHILCCEVDTHEPKHRCRQVMKRWWHDDYVGRTP